MTSKAFIFLIQPQSELDIGSWYVTHPTTLPTTPPRTLRVVVVQAGSLKQFLLLLLVIEQLFNLYSMCVMRGQPITVTGKQAF